ncbi:MAG: glucosidase [Proteobacteria bacterium]|nr:glucosidase [Pseudomonadota bacterium]
MSGRRRTIYGTEEGARLLAIEEGEDWRRWGPYLSERQWGTVREDYSANGDAWAYFPHAHARSRAYRWGEDGIAGFSDLWQHWCLSVALWNGRDPFLKERLFGVTNTQGNHGEDVKELYFYLDATPTHSYMRMLYKYPQAAFPYEQLIAENARRGRQDPEFEITDTAAFDDGRYFDVVTEYAKASPRDILMRVTVTNRAPEAATLHLLPHLWARNTWSWAEGRARPALRQEGQAVLADHPLEPPMRLDADQSAAWLFCENDTNTPLLFDAKETGPFKDGINDCVVNGAREAVSADAAGTKCAALLVWTLAPGETRTVRLRFRPRAAPPAASDAFADFDATMARRRSEADDFYGALQADIADGDARLVQRQALAGMIWSKQLYLYNVQEWLDGDPAQPKPPAGRTRNRDWRHLNNADIISMPDKWEYPWYASWDLAFHCVTFALIDPAFAKGQLILMLREYYMHPNGQLPAYEWNFGDANPPVHAWAAWRVYKMEEALTGVPDRDFLERVFHKLLLNFTWWVNREDADGRNVFQGGFLGLDNIGVFDRSQPLPGGGTIDQADATSWMAMYTLTLLRIAIELAMRNPVYEDVATKFFEHFLYIAEAMTDLGGQGIGLWDDADGFFYDVFRQPNGRMERLRVRSLVGLLPMLAVEVLDGAVEGRLPEFANRLRWFLRHRPDLAGLISRWAEPGMAERGLLSMLRGHRLKKLLERMLDETEFLSPYGVRSMSRAHLAAPFVLELDGQRFGVDYEPGESQSGAFGGNSNWRGPIWLPANALLIDALRKFDSYYGPEFTVECPVGSGRMLNLAQVADELSRRVIALFAKDADGARASLRGTPVPRAAGAEEALLFHEFFHGDNGLGLGASHQTGWTGLVALLIQDLMARGPGRD